MESVVEVLFVCWFESCSMALLVDQIKLLTMIELMINEWLHWVCEWRDNTGYWSNPFKSYWSGIMKTIGNSNDKNCD